MWWTDTACRSPTSAARYCLLLFLRARAEEDLPEQPFLFSLLTAYFFPYVCLYTDLSLGEGLGWTTNEDPERSIFASAGTSGHHDQCFWTDPTQCGEVHQEGDGPVCQQHHISPLPVSQPTGDQPHSYRGKKSVFCWGKEKYKTPLN